MTQHETGPVGFRKKFEIDFLLFSKWLLFSAQCCHNFFFKYIAFLRYGNFMDNIVTDRWKVHFEKKALKVCESEQSIGIITIQKTLIFYMKMLSLDQILQATNRVSIDMLNLKINLGTIEIFWHRTVITQNLIFWPCWQMVPFDIMLSHIFIICYMKGACFEIFGKWIFFKTGIAWHWDLEHEPLPSCYKHL